MAADGKTLVFVDGPGACPGCGQRELVVLLGFLAERAEPGSTATADYECPFCKRRWTVETVLAELGAGT